MSKFNSTHNKGFQMTFDNGFRLSVQWGVGNYCQRKSDLQFGDEMKGNFWESTSAEIAVFNHIMLIVYPQINSHENPSQIFLIGC